MMIAASQNSVVTSLEEKHTVDHLLQKLTDDQFSILQSTWLQLFELTNPKNDTAQAQKLREGFTPDQLHEAFRNTLKNDNPDTMMVRFLNFSHWQSDKCLELLVKTLQWRRDMGVDNKIVPGGDTRYAHLEKDGVSTEEKEFGKQILDQARSGKAFVYGTDKDGRPVVYVRARYHYAKNQSIKALEEYIIFAIENLRMVLRPPVTGVTAVLDLQGFTMANMDWAILKLGISGLLQMYPEALVRLHICHAPWIVSGIWATVKRWLDPELASRVQFLSKYADLAPFIDDSNRPEDVGGTSGWKYHYVEPERNPGPVIEDSALRTSLTGERNALLDKFELEVQSTGEGSLENLKSKMGERQQIAEQLSENYWKLDKLVRGESWLDRLGIIGEDGSYNPFR